MFTTVFVQPIFNLLVLIYALLPGHNFGLAIILFTILVRLAMWPLVKKQLHHAKAMRGLQPELKRIKQETKGDRQKESMMVMELYKERQINPFAPIGLLIVQLPILLALYSCLTKIIHDPTTLTTFTYPVIQNLSWMRELATDIHKFDNTLLGIIFPSIDLAKAAVAKGMPLYWPAFLLVVGSAITQYYQSKQLMPDDKKARSLRTILKEAGSGRQVDNSEVNAATSKTMRYLIPAFILIFTLQLPAALSLYWFASGLVAIIQQGRLLKRDETELEAVADKNTVIEGEVIPPKPKTKKKAKKTAKKRRK